MVIGFIQAAAFTIPLGQVKKLFGISTSREGFIGQIIDIFEELIAGKANWLDFGVGMGSIALLVILGKIKAYSEGPSCKNMNGIIKKILWFLGTAKAAIVCLLMMLIAWLIESDEAVENFVEVDCLSNGRDVNSTTPCTILTLTKISNVEFPEFGPPAFSFSYEFCNDGSFDSQSRYPEQYWSPDQSKMEELGELLTG